MLDSLLLGSVVGLSTETMVAIGPHGRAAPQCAKGITAARRRLLCWRVTSRLGGMSNRAAQQAADTL